MFCLDQTWKSTWKHNAQFRKEIERTPVGTGYLRNGSGLNTHWPALIPTPLS